MIFQSLASLWFALSLPLIALLYMLKRTYIDTEISSHLLWNRALKEQEANRPWQKLRSSLLLLLQLLAAALLVVALMNPGIWQSPGAKGHVVIVLDRSASMTGLAQPAAGGGPVAGAGTKFELAQSAALQWIEEHAGEGVTLIATGQDPQLIALREHNQELLLEAVKQLTPTFEEADGAAAVSMADALLREVGGQGGPSGKMIVITDGSWPDAAAAAGLVIQSPVEIVKVNGVQSGNFAVAAFGLRADPAQPGYEQAVITLRNDSSKPARMNIGIYADGGAAPVAEASANVDAGEWASVAVGGLPEAEVYKAQLEETADSYTADNALFRFSSASKEQTALLVTKGNLFLDKALQLAGVRTTAADPAVFEPQQDTKEAVDWVVIDGIGDDELASPQWRELLASKPVWRMLSPSSPLSEGDHAVQPGHSGVELQEHEITRFLSLADTHISKLVQTDAVNWGEPIVKYGGYPAVYAGKEGGKPKLLFTFDPHDSDLPLRPEFPILAAQAAQWMSGGGVQQLGEVQAGAAIDIDYASGTASASWEPVEHAPGLERYVNASSSPVVESSEAGLASSQIAPAIPGLYRFVEQDEDDNIIASRYAAVSLDQRELLQQSDKPLVLASGAAEAQKGSASSMRESKESQVAESLVRWIALLLLAVMTLEWGVFSRGRTV
ncbi:VWA domain-containing protein [Paenibacillus oenotherae]|uniref:VWA domain-containing protein n=1 Tax=Paenibacillus oenotherae TaxID=1435645 RepID=A0ABS7D052_9BACL|nr:VWA domain-containing protein [Paenibacillus oenotherae]MBW7473199.1 VWA domain-containing protein [Paenibacillus oenotherae]